MKKIMEKAKQSQAHFPKKRPENTVNEFLRSKIVTANTGSGVFLKDDVLEISAKAHLAYLQSHLLKTNKLLEEKRAFLAAKKRDMRRQWKDLEDKETDLRANFKNFNQFVKENEEKRLRARKKMKEDKQYTWDRQNEIEMYQRKYENMLRACQNMDRKIKEYKMYSDFLQLVIESTAFEQIIDIVDRYISLADARNFMTVRHNADLSNLEHAQHEMVKLIEEKSFIIMGLNNQVANLQARYEHANIKALESELLVTEIKNNAVKQMSDIERVKTAIWNTYVHMAASKKHPIKIKKDNVEEQMMYLNRTLTEIDKVSKMLKRGKKLSVASSREDLY